MFIAARERHSLCQRTYRERGNIEWERERERGRNANESRKLLHDDNLGRGMASSPCCHRLPRSNIISSHESWKQCNNLAAVAENKLCFLFDWFTRNFAAGKGGDREKEADCEEDWRVKKGMGKERWGDYMTCGLLQQTIPIKCDIRDRDNIQMSRVNKNSRWVSWTARIIKCAKHLRESKVRNLMGWDTMRWNISETETETTWEIPERYLSYVANDECCFGKVFSDVSATFEVPLQHCAAC